MRDMIDIIIMVTILVIFWGCVSRLGLYFLLGF